jgi:hypothetical protein
VRLEDLVRALVHNDALTARAWVADAGRVRLDWGSVPRPADLDALGLAIAAGVAELLASRAGQPPPPWTNAVPAAPQPFLLVRAAGWMPRLRRICEVEGPEPLRRRALLAPPEFLTTA